MEFSLKFLWTKLNPMKPQVSKETLFLMILDANGKKERGRMGLSSPL
jgi:hypothetical protein